MIKNKIFGGLHMSKDIEALDMIIDKGMPSLIERLKEIDEELNREDITSNKKESLLKERKKLNKVLEKYKQQQKKEGGNHE